MEDLKLTMTKPLQGEMPSTSSNDRDEGTSGVTRAWA